MSGYQTLLDATQIQRNQLFTLPVLADVASGNFTSGTYLRFLTNAYHHVRYTVPLMMACGANLAPHQTGLLPKLRTYINEEIGHEQWILNDLSAAGFDAQKVAQSEPNLPAELLVAYVRDYIYQRNACGFFGMVMVLEGTSASLASATASIIQQKLELPDAAFTYLNSHGELDQDHVAFFADLVDSLTDEDLKHVIHVARRVYALYSDVLSSVVSDELLHAA